MEPRLEASDASVANQIRSIGEWASCAPAKGIITSDGIGMQADCTAISRNTIAYFAAAERPASPINSLENIALSISRTRYTRTPSNHCGALAAGIRTER